MAQSQEPEVPNLSWIDDRDIIDITERLKGGGGGDGFLPGPQKLEAILPLVVLLLLLIWWGWTGVRIVQPGEVGVVLTFGKFSRTATPGLNFIVPWPVQELYRVSVTKIRREEIGSRTHGSSRDSSRIIQNEALMLTGDENIVAANMVVQYRVRAGEAFKYLFNVVNPQDTMKKAAEASLREIVGHIRIDAILTDERAEIQDSISVNLHEILKAYDMGLEIINVQLQDVFPPEKVEPSFKDVASAREDKEKLVNQAEGYRNEIFPRAQGEAEAMLEKAMAQKEKTIKQAEGDTARFLRVLESYSAAKNITRIRLYLETMEKVFGKARKVIVEEGAVNRTLPVLPLLPSPEGR